MWGSVLFAEKWEIGCVRFVISNVGRAVLLFYGLFGNELADIKVLNATVEYSF